MNTLVIEGTSRYSKTTKQALPYILAISLLKVRSVSYSLSDSYILTLLTYADLCREEGEIPFAEVATAGIKDIVGKENIRNPILLYIAFDIAIEIADV